MSRYVLHAGIGRSWNTDPALEQYFKLSSNDWNYLRSHAQSQFQEKFDWWTVFDLDDGMSHVCGWSTGRTSPRARGELCPS